MDYLLHISEGVMNLASPVCRLDCELCVLCMLIALHM